MGIEEIITGQPDKYNYFLITELKGRIVMTANDILYSIQTTGKEYKSDNGKVGLRYRDGRFQVLCETCVDVKWVNVADEYALKVATRLLTE